MAASLSSPAPPTPRRPDGAAARIFAILLPVLKGKNRFCDVCGTTIMKGEKYAIVTVSQDDTELFHALSEGEPGMAPTISVDSHGNLRLDLCLICRMNTRFPGDETVQ